jgi:hypothetical protein
MLQKAVRNRRKVQVIFQEPSFISMLCSKAKRRKHKRRHELRSSCPRCSDRFASNKELNEHCYRHHKTWAKDAKMPDPRRRCLACGAKLSKACYIKRHLKRFPDCKLLVGGLSTDSQTAPYDSGEE